MIDKLAWRLLNVDVWPFNKIRALEADLSETSRACRVYRQELADMKNCLRVANKTIEEYEKRLREFGDATVDPCPPVYSYTEPVVRCRHNPRPERVVVKLRQPL